MLSRGLAIAPGLGCCFFGPERAGYLIRVVVLSLHSLRQDRSLSSIATAGYPSEMDFSLRSK
jgi:hypothetical protein